MRIRVVPRINNWIVVNVNTTNIEEKFKKFKSKRKAKEYIKTLGDTKVELIKKDYPLFPVIEKLRDTDEIKCLCPEAKYQVVRKGSIDIVYSFKEAFITWVWLVCPRVAFLYWRIKKKYEKNISRN